MATIKLNLLLLVCYVLSDSVDARPEGPLPAACTLLEPIHNTFTPQPAQSSPVMLEGLADMYEQGNIIQCECYGSIHLYTFFNVYNCKLLHIIFDDCLLPY